MGCLSVHDSGTSDEIDVSETSSFDVHDDRAFVALLRDCDPKMRTLAWRLLRDETGTDDALQDAYLKAHRTRRSFVGSSDDFVAWLYRITYNTCLDHLRARKRRRTLDTALQAIPTETTSIANTIVTRSAVRHAVGQLRPEWAAAVVLVDLEGLSYADAGEALGLPIGTVSTHVNRGRARLRELLNLEGPS